MKLFRRKNEQEDHAWDGQQPAMKSSICTGETVAGFLDAGGKFQDAAKNRNAVFQPKTEYGVQFNIHRIEAVSQDTGKMHPGFSSGTRMSVREAMQGMV